MHALIDGDIVAFSCAVYNENNGWEAVVRDINDMMNRIIKTTESQTFQVYLTGKNNFRYEIDPKYKANRKDKVDPQFRQDALAYLVIEWGAKITDGIEADDALGIDQSKAEPLSTIICTIDKDLKQIPGKHYNWRKDEFDMVSTISGIRFFYRQLLTGDRSDNISGLAGIGPVKSSQLIDNVEDEFDMFEIVRALYNDDERLLKNGRLLYIHKKEGDLWNFPTIQKPTMVQLPLF